MAEQAGDEARLGHARPRRHAGDIAHPEPIGCRCVELLFDEVRRSCGRRIGSGGDELLAQADPRNDCLSHEPSHPVTAYVVAGAQAAFHNLLAPYTQLVWKSAT